MWVPTVWSPAFRRSSVKPPEGGTPNQVRRRQRRQSNRRDQRCELELVKTWMNNRTKLSHNVAAVVVALGALILAAAFLRSGSGQPARRNPRPAQDSASNASLPEAS